MVEWKKLGEVMKIVRGASPRPITSYLTSDSNGVNWIKIGDVEPGAKYITRCIEKVTKEGAQKSRYLHSGDFILSNSMSFGRPYILKIDGCIHDGWIAMSDFETHLSSGYLYEVLNSNRVQSYWKMKANNGGAMTNLNSDIVKDTIIPIPSLGEQARIVGILDTFTSAIDNLKEQIAQRRKQYEYYRDQLLDLEKREGVEMKTLGDIGKCVAGATPSTKVSEYWDGGNIPWMSSGEVHQKNVTHTTNFITKKGYENASTKMLPVGTIVIALAGQGKTRGSVAITAIELCTNQSLCGVIISDVKIVNKFIYYYMSTRYDDLRRISSGDGTRGGLNLKMISSYLVPIPPLSEQQSIVSILDTFEVSIQNLEAQLKEREKQYEYYRNKLLTFE
jgi:type I restriction enzyme S subunit